MNPILVTLLLATKPSAVKWQLKEGCEENSTVVAQHILLPAGHPLSCIAKQELWDLGVVFAWGQCQGNKVMIGTGESEDECRDSMKVHDGFYREIVFEEALVPGDCKCTSNGDYFNAFHCVEPSEIEAVAAQSYKSQPTEAIPHEISDTGYTLTWTFFIVFFFFFILAFMM